MKKIMAILTIGLLSIGGIWAINEHSPLESMAGMFIPPVGHTKLRVLSPRSLELTSINTVPDDAPPETWNWVDKNHKLRLPYLNRLKVQINGRSGTILRKGFKRRVLYAAHEVYDLRIGNQLYLELGADIPDHAQVVLSDPLHQLGLEETRWEVTGAPDRISPVIHVNQNGYDPLWQKKAMVGYYQGNLGELDLPEGMVFRLELDVDNTVVFEGELHPRTDKGYEYADLPYQHVLEADFSSVTAPGTYRLAVPGLGVSQPFLINEGAPAMMARTYALGLYHQRCGTDNRQPFTRFTHDLCHMAPAEIPTAAFEKVNDHLKGMARRGQNETPQNAPTMTSVDASLYPFVRKGRIDVTGGHHDAGDYSKYTIHSAQFIHHLVFAADALPGVGQLDNLGTPESGDGISDLIQIAKWEADYLVKLQDEDGGFFFLVYPRDRRYETDVLPDQGDPQVVFPKNTSATAAAVAALAQIGSSPHVKKAFPVESAQYLAAATKGWQFIENAHEKYGEDGAYQKISHYGDMFNDTDELVWAATELFLATGEVRYHQYVLTHFNPADRATQRWGWVRLYEGFGNAIRSYGFADKTGRQDNTRLDSVHLQRCIDEILAGGQDQADYAAGNAYGLSFPFETKRFKTAGWFLAMDAAFDMVAASPLNQDAWLAHILTNAAYEGGVNPNNLSFVTGTGWQHPVEIVHQYAQNDDRFLPPTGIPVGHIQRGFEGHKPYGRYLNNLSFPHDEDALSPYPFYDRYGDTFNTGTEATMVKQARALAAYAYLMARTAYKTQPWETRTIVLEGLPDKIEKDRTYALKLKAGGASLAQTRIIWESSAAGPFMGSTYPFKASEYNDGWIEAEVLWPDGHRAFLRKEYRMPRW